MPAAFTGEADLRKQHQWLRTKSDLSFLAVANRFASERKSNFKPAR